MQQSRIENRLHRYPPVRHNGFCRGHLDDGISYIRRGLTRKDISFNCFNFACQHRDSYLFEFAPQLQEVGGVAHWSGYISWLRSGGAYFKLFRWISIQSGLRYSPLNGCTRSDGTVVSFIGFGLSLKCTYICSSCEFHGCCYSLMTWSWGSTVTYIYSSVRISWVYCSGDVGGRWSTKQRYAKEEQGKDRVS